MTGEWIKWTKGLPHKREVVALAKKLRIDRRIVACMLMEVWEWADDNTADGHVAGVTETFLDELVGVTDFGAAMADPIVGWLLVDSEGITFPNYERHNGKPAKQRALAAERKARQREREAVEVTRASRNGHGRGVTGA